jgi:3-phenylpropionate/cinnamic acid dioxygenase small subunit
MLEQDLLYTAPLRLTRSGPNKDRDVVRTMMHFDDNYQSILMRAGRLTKSAWAEDPPSRTRRFVTNVRVAEWENADEYEVSSYLYVERSRMDNPENETISAERRDIWRLVDGAYKLASREIIVDQSTLGMSNFAIFF